MIDYKKFMHQIGTISRYFNPESLAFAEYQLRHIWGVALPYPAGNKYFIGVRILLYKITAE